MVRKNFEQVWEQLRGQKPSRADFLEEVQIKGLRGISDLRIPLPFPVTVLAGPNGCGKSTVLFALASAYRTPGSRTTEYTPARLFPDFRPAPSREDGNPLSDGRIPVEIVFAYVANAERTQMKWSRGRDKWNRSFFGRKSAGQPERAIYLRTLANLTNPSEMRSVLQLARKKYSRQVIDASNIAFAQRILAFRYARLAVLTAGVRSLLFAERADTGGQTGSKYSEFHMSAGERSILRLSIEISKIDNALVLIDEVEAGLHPYLQQILMLELQRLALRNQLQIVVTTHSPTILDTVPIEARVFLERTEDNVVRREPYRDLIQRVLYGRAQEVLSILCEDEEAESFVRGVFDVLGPKIDLFQNDIDVGRNTGKDEFPAHLETLARFRKLQDVLFVLDGDGRTVGSRMEARAAQLGQSARIAYLPGDQPPEMWVWNLLRSGCERYGPLLGMTPQALSAKLDEQENLFSGAVDKPAAIAKGKLNGVAEATARSVAQLMRLTAKSEAERKTGEVFALTSSLEDIVRDWRTARG
jgi:predicted ATPase